MNSCWKITIRIGEKQRAEPMATYVKVPPGEYIFRVRATSSKGVLSDEKTLQIIISPPWWKTWWAQAIFYFSLAFLIFLVYRFQLNRRLALAEAVRLKELDTVKTQLYTNITHEFQNAFDGHNRYGQTSQRKPKRVVQRRTEYDSSKW